MSAGYLAVGWSPGKRRYDLALAAAIALYLAVFVGVSLVRRPEITVETLLIRGFATVAILLLHLVLAIGPLARLDRRFLPLLWNRRHLGVTMFCCAAAHGGLALFQFHALGDRHPLVSLLVSNRRFASLADFPFQPLGAAALAILFLMAATSHDFWLANLSAPVWKRLHMAVYFAYALLVGHVALGILQDAVAPTGAVLLGLGMATLAGLHLAAGWRGRALDRELAGTLQDGYLEACRLSDIGEKRARIVTLSGERVAIFRHDGKLSAVSNVCQHQNGPLGEGRIVDGCITCPWHGYQYRPADGRSPAPFTERVPTFRLRLVDGDRVFVDPRPQPAGTYVEPVEIPQESSNTRGDVSAASDEFFVGYLPVPPGLVRFVRAVAITIVVGFGGLAAAIASAQRPLGSGGFEFARESVVTGGIPQAAAVPGIRPGDSGRSDGEVNGFLALVGEGKHGPPAGLAELAGRTVEVRGHRIERDGLGMLEVAGFLDRGPAATGGDSAAPRALGRFRLRGEIVDSKCYLGVMKPGSGKAHRDCAVRCISGGSPPLFVMRSTGEPERIVRLWLAAADGAPLADRILDYVAEPVEVEGEVTSAPGGLRFTFDPGAIRRVGE
ncbi:MAG: Rieske 2Fe-2S domain-containing protein [Thermoanaerobaculia bacterium]